MIPAPASDDFSELARAVDRPYVYWIFGGVDPETWDQAQSEGNLAALPCNHSPKYAPVIQPTLKTGVEAMALAAMTFLGNAAIEE